ncbi:MAG: acyl-CoA dehydrogenase domain-containing protein, partial [Pseudomonadota bacterium]
MDVHAGKAVCDGPSNYIFGAYQMIPVGITVEGANILTRSLITFAQGALRSHPYLYAEISAAQDTDRKAGLATFEKAFLSHISFAFSNMAGALVHNLTGGRFTSIPAAAPAPTHRWYRQLARASRNFALVADLCVAVLGGGLKSKQRITGRMADALSELYMLSVVLKRFEDDGALASDVPLMDLAATNALHRFEVALQAAIDNFPVAPVRWLMRPLAAPLGRAYKPASDALAKKAVKLVAAPNAVRDRLTRDIFISTDSTEATGLLEITWPKVIAARDIEKRIERGVRAGQIDRFHGRDWIAQAVDKELITADEGHQMREVDALVYQVISVDHFAPDALRPNYLKENAVQENAGLHGFAPALPAAAE